MQEMLTEDKILHILFAVLYLLFLFERGYFQLKAMIVSGEAGKLREHKGKLAAWISLLLFAQLWVIGSFIYIAKPAAMAWTRFQVPSWVRWLGMMIAASGMAFELTTQIFLGRNYSTTLHIGEKQSLVTAGPYRYIRHPMYTALVAVGIGMGLMSSSWYFLIPFVVTGIVIIFRTRREEEAMIEKFGDAYVQYARRTGRFLPIVGKKKSMTEDERI
jgi:protein-S-isoprenylcysteine O-methyltransferase Ste14